MRGKRIKQFILILCMVCLFGMNVQAEDVYTEFHVDKRKSGRRRNSSGRV